ncbi:hypothetical protein QTH91_20180 [Variovorax dokdonensis]|uniref:Uncharacterized protein n=1 Tax=Variovorax dokdonensis TaxID=344883 RepID=A0ABT7NFY1_9BURK|nr:hypothetical protein [Variovorax dokdonensis]MDM0046821.1 hypothetical protein [Variovorax dokdonensis]
MLPPELRNSITGRILRKSRSANFRESKTSLIMSKRQELINRLQQLAVAEKARGPSGEASTSREPDETTDVRTPKSVELQVRSWASQLGRSEHDVPETGARSRVIDYAR